MSDNEHLPASLGSKALHCCDCGGWPIDEGACFMAVFLVRHGKPVLSGICELCYLKRLRKRGEYVNMASGPTWQIDLPEIGLHRRR